MAKSTLIEASSSIDTKVTVGGFITVEIGNTLFTLRGTVGDHIIVAYHAPFAEAADLGNIRSMIIEVGTALGSKNMAKEVDDALVKIEGVPLLGPITVKIAEANIRITDLEINTATKTYQFGFGLDFTKEPVELPPLKLNSFGLVITAQG
jgi:hypothetical protein